MIFFQADRRLAQPVSLRLADISEKLPTCRSFDTALPYFRANFRVESFARDKYKSPGIFAEKALESQFSLIRSPSLSKVEIYGGFNVHRETFAFENFRYNSRELK